MSIQLSVSNESFLAKVRALRMNVPRKARLVAETTAREVVSYAKSYPGPTKSGLNKGDGPRKIHPGQWADRTSNLMNSLSVSVKEEPGWVKASFGVGENPSEIQITAGVNTVIEYAEELDAKEGYEVLGGADKVAKEALRKNGQKVFK